MSEKLTEAQCDEFERRARNAGDNSNAERLVADAFRAEYMRGIAGEPTASAETHARSMELYDFVIGGQNRAKKFEDDYELFQAAAAAGRAALKEGSRQ